MGRPTGSEPATSGTTNRRSNQLSYDRHIALSASSSLEREVRARQAARQA